MPPRTTPKPNALVVHPSTMMRGFIAYALEPLCTVAVSSEGADAWERLQALPFDLVLAATSTPGVSARELASRLTVMRQETGKPRFILLSDLEVEGHALDTRFDFVLTQPFGMDALVRAVKMVLPA